MKKVRIFELVEEYMEYDDYVTETVGYGNGKAIKNQYKVITFSKDGIISLLKQIKQEELL